MLSLWENTAGVLATTLRAGAFIFLRWIPGHHFPPLIVSLLVLYLLLISTKSQAFGSGRPSLHEAFPAVFRRRPKTPAAVVDKDEVVVLSPDTNYDDPYVYEDESRIFKVLLFGIPDWREWKFSYLTIAVNILLTLMTLDLVFRGPLFHPGDGLRFARVGFVDDHSVRIVAREPEQEQLPLQVLIRTAGSEDWQVNQALHNLQPQTDHTYTLYFDTLKPETTYVYELSNNLTGSFRTAAAAGTPGAESLTFLTSSCIKANFPYRPLSHSLAIHGFEHLSKLLRSLSDVPSFMLFLGDFIYVDVPLRLSSTFSHYLSEYRRVYASPSWQLEGVSSIPWLHTLDDHEIANDWSGGNQTAPFPAASNAFMYYHAFANPPQPTCAQKFRQPNATYFQFTQGPASFFMLDTRRYRTDPERSQSSSAKPLYGSSSQSTNPPSAEDEPASMLGHVQLGCLLEYLRTPEPAGVYWKFVASSVPFTKNWRFGTSDTWGGFLTERERILEAMHQAEATLGVRIIILSGDRHEFAAIRFPPPILHLHAEAAVSLSGDKPSQDITTYDHTPQAGPHEFSTGPLSMFYLPLRTFRQIDHQDVAIKYIPDGNSKVGVISIHNFATRDRRHHHHPHQQRTTDNTFFFFSFSRFLAAIGVGDGNGGSSSNTHRKHTMNQPQNSLLKYSLWIDGEVAWEYVLTN